MGEWKLDIEVDERSHVFRPNGLVANLQESEKSVLAGSGSPCAGRSTCGSVNFRAPGSFLTRFLPNHEYTRSGAVRYGPAKLWLRRGIACEYGGEWFVKTGCVQLLRLD